MKQCHNQCPISFPFYASVISGQCLDSCEFYSIDGSGSKICQSTCSLYKIVDNLKQCVSTCGLMYQNGVVCQSSCDIFPNLYISSDGQRCVSKCSGQDAYSLNFKSCDNSCFYYQKLGVKFCTEQCPIEQPFKYVDVRSFCVGDCNLTAKTFVNAADYTCVSPGINFAYQTIHGVYSKVFLASCPDYYVIVAGLGNQCVSVCPSQLYLNGVICASSCSSGYYIVTNQQMQCVQYNSAKFYTMNSSNNLKLQLDDCLKFAQTDNECVDYCEFYEQTTVKMCRTGSEAVCQHFELVSNYKKCVGTCSGAKQYIKGQECADTCKGYLIDVDGVTCVGNCGNNYVSMDKTRCQIAICNFSVQNGAKQCLQECYIDKPFMNIITNSPMIYECISDCATVAGKKFVVDQNNLTCIQCTQTGYSTFYINYIIAYKCESACPNDQIYQDPANTYQSVQQCLYKCPQDKQFIVNNNICSNTCSSLYYITDFSYIQPYLCVNLCAQYYIINDSLNQCVDECPPNFQYILGQQCVYQCNYYQIIASEKYCKLITDIICNYYIIDAHNGNKECVGQCQGIYQYINGQMCQTACNVSPNYYIDIDGVTCVQNCGLNYYSIDQLSCLTTCTYYLTTQGQKQCTKTMYKCPPGLRFIYQNQCQTNCPTGLYFINNNMECITCSGSQTYKIIFVEGISVSLCLNSCSLLQDSSSAYFGVNNCVTQCPEINPYLNNGVCQSTCINQAYHIDINGSLICDSLSNCYYFTIDVISNYKICQLTCPKYNQAGLCVETCEFYEIDINGLNTCVLESNCQYYLDQSGPKQCLSNCGSLYNDGKVCRKYCDQMPNKYIEIDNISCISSCGLNMVSSNKLNCLVTCPNSLYYIDNNIKYCTESAFCPIQFPFKSNNQCLNTCTQFIDSLQTINCDLCVLNGYSVSLVNDQQVYICKTCPLINKAITYLNKFLCIDQCTSDKPYIENDECFQTCSTLKYTVSQNILTCVQSCPLYYIINTTGTVSQYICIEYCYFPFIFIDGQECKLSCPSYVQTINDFKICTSCTFYEIVNGLQRCVQTCDQADNKQYINGFECVNQCPFYVSIDNITCVSQCEVSQSISGSLCDQYCRFYLEGGIQKCSIDPVNCPLNYPFQILSFGTTYQCVNSCPTGFADQNTKLCSSCQVGESFIIDYAYNIQYYICQPQTCTNSLKYRDPNQVYNGVLRCVYQCPESHPYLNSTSNICQSSCQDNTYTNQSAFPQNLICQAYDPIKFYIINYLFNDGQKLQVDQCGGDYNFIQNQQCLKTCVNSFYQIINKQNYCRTGLEPECQILSDQNNNICVDTCQYYLNNKVCVQQCPQYIDLDQIHCTTQCPYLNITTCVSSCWYTLENENDINSQKICTKVDNQCPETAPLHTINSQHCIKQCPIGYYIDENDNTLCINQCNGNRPGFTLIQINSVSHYKCVSQCTVFLDQNLQYQSLSLCIQNCPFIYSDANDYCLLSCDGILDDGIHCDPSCNYYLDNNLNKICMPQCTGMFPFFMQRGSRIECLNRCPSFASITGYCLPTCGAVPIPKIMFEQITQVCYSSCPSAVPYIFGNICVQSCDLVNQFSRGIFCTTSCLPNEYICDNSCISSCSQCSKPYYENNICQSSCPMYYQGNQCVSSCVLADGQQCVSECPINKHNVFNFCQFSQNCELEVDGFCKQKITMEPFETVADTVQMHVTTVKYSIIGASILLLLLIIILILTCCQNRIKTKTKHAINEQKTFKQIIYNKQKQIPTRIKDTIPIIENTYMQIIQSDFAQFNFTYKKEEENRPQSQSLEDKQYSSNISNQEEQETSYDPYGGTLDILE
ncbi:Conserved_hypothetical protein [Hexamita inflata]|uniref:Transmembrane protein n=1 Tax=Hexamita inflata TaxID=28002 RepID=A0AA86NEB6_9EUKA|nr:Conserved hypothetical protein [Hexamita inflata]